MSNLTETTLPFYLPRGTPGIVRLTVIEDEADLVIGRWGSETVTVDGVVYEFTASKPFFSTFAITALERLVSAINVGATTRSGVWPPHQTTVGSIVFPHVVFYGRVPGHDPVIATTIPGATLVTEHTGALK